ncbi:MAG: prolyl oligopeptidase family serine peptidase [bacterium]|nr:prolyl oligopeptidase family serine peptidase [bacterium]
MKNFYSLRIPLSILTLLLCAGSELSAQSAAPTDVQGIVSKVKWSKNSSSVSWTNQGERFELDLGSMRRASLGKEKGTEGRMRRRTRRARGPQGASTGEYIGRPTRGHQYTQVNSPDGQWEAHYRDWNVVLVNKKSKKTVAVTTKGDVDIHYGTASWVYGEELGQRSAMWWTPDSKKLVFYRFDDRGVEPFHLVTGWSKINTKQYAEYYPKAGAKNPVASLLVYDLESKKTTEIACGGKLDGYLFHVHASPDGERMLVHSTGRLQQQLRVLEMDLETGTCKLVVEEHQDTWQSNKPGVRYLEDGERFLWSTEKSGYTHFELRDLDGRSYGDVTRGECQTERLDFVDEATGQIGFSAYSSTANPYYLQYHVASLDGKKQQRVTSLDYHHSNFSLSPNKQWLVAQYEEVNTPPSTVLYRMDGSVAAMLAEGDASTAANLAEMFSFRSDDDKFDIYGILYKPESFDSTKAYPLINSLYAGPGSREISARYVSRERRENKRGYLVVKVNNRGCGARGKAFLGAAYLRLGDVDIQDHADAVRLLAKRDYVDGQRVGIVGHSYGGFMAAMGIFKHPDVYNAAVIGSGVTDWRNYDTIYTERYMSTPQLNKKGYDTGAAMTYVENFKGKVHIMHGMVDDNVHPNNAFQLIAAMDAAGKPYESRFFPNAGHSLGPGFSKTTWEFFDRILKP